MSTVYGTNKTASDNEDHESLCPQSLARAVYRALLSGIKLPQLNDSKELRAALLAFEPSAHFPESQEADVANGNTADSEGEEHEGGRPKNSLVHRKASSATEGERIKKPPSCSLLMLEAVSRRRLDAVRQLHEACPDLLASIPLFDLKSRAGSTGLDRITCHSQAAGSPLASPPNTSHTNPVSHSASTYSSFVLTPNTFQLHRSSRLLDLAAENRSLLVFVLQHHPQVDKNHHRQKSSGVTDSPLRPAPHFSKKYDACDSVGSAYDNRQQPVDSPRTPPASPPAGIDSQNIDEQAKNDGLKSFYGGTVNKDDDEKREEEADLLADLDPENPITICIRKDNAEVLQYLLFKHVWQHFLLDEIFNLPHNSYIPEFRFGDCPWFVHCAALMGCPQLLRLVLSGDFCYREGQIWSSTTSTNIFVPGIPDSAVPDCKEEDIGGGMQSLRENQETCVNLEEKVDDRNVIEKVSTDGEMKNINAAESDQGACDENPAPEQQNIIQAPLSTSSPDPCMTIPSCSYEPSSAPQNTVHPASQTQRPVSASCSPKSSKKPSAMSEAATVRMRSSSPQTQSLNTPDPNRMFPVSLPVMDRWISRCMHVKLTPLHLACWRCDPDSVKVLLDGGANVHLLAEELPTPGESADDHLQDTTSGQPTNTASAESSMELNLNFVSVTVNSSSLDLTTMCSSVEEMLKVSPDRHSGLSPLAMLALGIRSPPDFSLSIGKSLGLVLPTLPELWGGQVDRSCYDAKRRLLEALHLLLDAGIDVNMSALVFGKYYRVMELFLQPSVDLYYAPLMPRGGRDSAVLRCMDLERVAEIVLSVCWELCLRGGRLGPSFASSLEWNLFRMDWMFLQNEPLQKRFLHLAVFLGLFPTLDPGVGLGSSSAHRLRGNPSPGIGGEESQSSVAYSAGGVDLREPYLPPYSSPPPRPSCVPWAPSTSRMSSPSTSSPSPVESEEGAPREPRQGIQRPQVTAGIVASYYTTAATQVEAPGTTYPQEAEVEPRPVVSPPVSQSHFESVPRGLRGRNQSVSHPCLPTIRGRRTHDEYAAAGQGPSPVMKAQRTVWALEERQRRYLERFVNEAVRLSMSQSSLALVLHFLCLSDLHMLARITQHMLHTSTASTESPLQRVYDAVCQAQLRTLQHSCKLTILLAARWCPAAVNCLPLPDTLKRYLLDPF